MRARAGERGRGGAGMMQCLATGVCARTRGAPAEGGGRCAGWDGVQGAERRPRPQRPQRPSFPNLSARPPGVPSSRSAALPSPLTRTSPPVPP